MFYLRGNANLTPYGHSWRFWLLAFVGWALGIQFHVGGIPFGAAYDRKRLDAWFEAQNAGPPLSSRPGMPPAGRHS